MNTGNEKYRQQGNKTLVGEMDFHEPTVAV